VSCHVTIDTPHHHQHKGHLYSVTVDLHLPGKEVVAGGERRHHHAHEDVYVAIRDAFNAVTRQVEDYARHQRGEIKRHEVPDHGQVTKLFVGYGFAETPDGTQVYFHENSVIGGGFRLLKVGDKVRIVQAEGESDKGPQASTITPIGKHQVVD
jgi:cold shock CspA family protein